MASLHPSLEIEENSPQQTEGSSCHQPIPKNLGKEPKYSISSFVAKTLFNLLKKYTPETTAEKKQRLLKAAEQKSKDQKKDQKKAAFLHYGLNHITSLVESKAAKLVVIAYDVDPIELVVWLP
jgi:Ribosomal protein L7Ae/L30e/S12e/Gadd45 family